MKNEEQQEHKEQSVMPVNNAENVNMSVATENALAAVTPANNAGKDGQSSHKSPSINAEPVVKVQDAAAPKWLADKQEAKAVGKIENKGKRIQSLSELEKAGNVHVLYLLAINNLEKNGKKDQQEGWTQLKKAVDKNNPDACLAYIERGLKDQAKGKEAAQYAQTLIADTKHMDQIPFDQAQKAALYDAYGMYCHSQGNNIEKAKASLEMACNAGNATHAYELGMIFFKDNNFDSAKRYFDQVDSNAKTKKMAEWISHVLQYGIDGKWSEEIIKPLIQAGSGLLDNDMKAFLICPRVLNKLKSNVKNSNAEILFICGFIAHKQWNEMKYDDAVTYYKACLAH